MIDQLQGVRIENYGVRWEQMPDDFRLVDRFAHEDWDRIVHGISTEPEWRAFVDRYKSIGGCFLLFIKEKTAPVGFVWVVYDNYRRRSVMIHGGSWQAGRISSTWLCRGMLCLAEHLLAAGFRVHSQCRRDNVRSFRFLRGLGFVPFEKDTDYTKLYIDHRRIARSAVCQRLKASL